MQRLADELVDAARVEAGDPARDLTLARAEADFCIASGPSARAASSWLPPAKSAMRTVRWHGHELEAVVRGTESFFRRRVAQGREGRHAVVVLGTPFAVDSGRVVRPADLLHVEFDAALGQSLWGQFTLLRIDLERDVAEWLVDHQRSLSPWTTERADTLVALRFAPTPRKSGAVLDPVGAGEFLLHGIVGGSATPVQGWSLLPAGSAVQWHRGRVSRSERSAHPIHARPESRSDPYRDFAETLESSLSRALKDYAGALLPLTGGIDSRLLLAALLHGGQDVSCYTHGAPGCADIRVAQSYKQLLDFEHRFHPITEDQHTAFPERVQRTLSRLGPDYDSLAYPHVLTSYAAEEPGQQLFLAGVGTGIHKVPYMPLTALDASPRSATEAIVRHYGRLDHRRLLRPAVARAAVEQMRASIARVVAECEPNTQRVHVVQYYHMQERLGRWAGKGIQLQDLCGYDLCYPFLEPRLMRESRRLGYARQHLGQKIIRAIALLEPALLRVSNANGWPCTPLTASALLRHAPAYWTGARNYAFRRVAGRVAKDMAIVEYGHVYRHAYRDWVLGLLDPARSHLCDIVEPAALRDLAEALRRGAPRTRTLGALAALELWCRS